MTLINPIYNINYAQVPCFKAKWGNESAHVAVPVQSTNVSFKGAEALATYNKIILNSNKLASEFINDVELTPCPKYIIPLNAKDLQGKKSFHPNGKIKTNTIFNDGLETTFHFDLSGNLIKVSSANKIVEINELGWQHIVETLGENYKKETYHENRDGIIETHVGLTKGNLRKTVSISDGYIEACKRTINDNGFYAEFNKDGSLKTYEKLVDN